ncbi:hypothetical protein PENSTE_c011G08847 [Penicillium steckii]|uniref:Uncharacterized protein n=1 Tax=Penicillium steckii TaxID=303698 RepID=A0A1V6T6S4_9EURO|nr:hypothetical protein PENSTE_c011G08847 [Penicillium steckii]
MRLTFLVLALTGLSMAAKPLGPGATCKKDGSMGTCKSNVCVQQKNADTGKCK